MDNLTHALTGILLSRAGLNRFNPRVTVMLAIAANTPDLDIVYGVPLGEEFYFSVHRGFSHGLAMAPLFALFPAAVVGLWRRPEGFSWLRAWMISLVGILSHLLLDLTNIYGIRLASPFAGTWYRLDITSVIDPWIWAILLTAVLWPALARLVTSEIGARTKAGPGIARVALVMLLAYDGARAFLHARVMNTIESRVYDGQSPRRVFALPHALTPLRWTGLVELDRSWHIVEIDVTREFDPASGTAYFKAVDSQLIERARGTKTFRTFLDFSVTTFWREVTLPGLEAMVEVSASDLRFGEPGSRRFQATALFAPDGSILRTWFQFTEPGAPPALR